MPNLTANKAKHFWWDETESSVIYKGSLVTKKEGKPSQKLAKPLF